MTKAIAAEFVLLASLWGASFLFLGMGSAEFGPWAAAGIRVLIASLVLTPIVIQQGHFKTCMHNAGKLLIAGIFSAGLPFMLYAYALLSISTGLSSILNATTPLFGALVAWVWLKDRPDRIRALGLIIGFTGVLMLSWSKASFTTGGTGWALLACIGATLSYGIATSYTKKYLSGIPPIITTSGTQVGATVFLLLPMVVYWPEQIPSLKAWGALVCAGVFCTALAYFTFFRLIAKTGPSKALTVSFMVPLFALFYGYVFLGEPVTSWMVVCGFIILGGVAMATGLIFKPKNP